MRYGEGVKEEGGNSPIPLSNYIAREPRKLGAVYLLDFSTIRSNQNYLI